VRIKGEVNAILRAETYMNLDKTFALFHDWPTKYFVKFQMDRNWILYGFLSSLNFIKRCRQKKIPGLRSFVENLALRICKL
jgi:hypothetical protein